MDGEQYPAPGRSERGRTVRVPQRRGGKALPSPGRKWPGGPRRYRVKSARQPDANSGGTADKKKRRAWGCEGAWTGARASAGPQGGPQPARVEGKATERPDPCEA